METLATQRANGEDKVPLKVEAQQLSANEVLNLAMLNLTVAQAKIYQLEKQNLDLTQRLVYLGEKLDSVVKAINSLGEKTGLDYDEKFGWTSKL